MHHSLEYLLTIIEAHKYFVLFPTAIFEGPIVTIISGFLIASGYLNGLTAYILILIADTIGDVLHYLVGYLLRHRRASKLLSFFRIDEKRILRVEKHFILHPKKSIIFGKLAHGVGGMIQVVAGVARMPFIEFLWISFLGTLPKSLLLLYIGYTFGKYLPQIDNYLSVGGFVLFGLTIITILGYIFSSKYLAKKAL